MIKVIAFDFVGVLAFEKDIELTNEEDKLERMFGPNISDIDYLSNANKIINKEESIIIKTIKNIINKLYYIKEKDIFKKIKNNYPNIKLLIATNHISYIRNYINKNLDSKYIDDIIISSKIHKIKPNKDFYQYILDKYNIKSNELLFVDDNIENINTANDMEINTIKINKNDNLFNKVNNYLKKTK